MLSDERDGNCRKRLICDFHSIFSQLPNFFHKLIRNEINNSKIKKRIFIYIDLFDYFSLFFEHEEYYKGDTDYNL